MDWEGKSALIAGGASFIGSHLVDALVDRGATVRVVDDLSAGRFENIENHVESGRIEFIEDDLLKQGTAKRCVEGMEVVFQLAAAHGGRGYVDLHQAAPSTNLAMDGMLFISRIMRRMRAYRSPPRSTPVLVCTSSWRKSTARSTVSIHVSRRPLS